MRLIKQAILSFRRGRSDKVYEVDLCEVGPAQYVVNFRYGRRGTSLREGSKTVMPVSLEQAQREFDGLVAAKIKKGYGHQGVGEPVGERPDAGAAPAERADAGASLAEPAETGELTPRARAVLARLERGRTGSVIGPELERAIWRAGELDLSAAEPVLLELWRRGDRGRSMQRYCIVWALARCGTRRAIPLLERVWDEGAESEATRRIALEGLRRLYDDDAREALIDAQIERMPPGLRGLARCGPADSFARELRKLMERADTAMLRALGTCYLIDNEHVRPALLDVLREAPLEPDSFVQLRRIFKAAELRRDGEVFGILAHRFEKTPGRRVSWHNRRSTTEPFREPTRMYLRRRVWRTLRRLGRDQSPDFVKMAVGVLLPFTDGDAARPRVRRTYRWRRPDATLHWDAFAGYWAFNHLLYGNSPRYYPDQNSRAWRCHATYTPGASAPDVREEAFPELWERTPEGLLHLLDESRCEQVHVFAARALRACAAFFDQLDTGAAAMLLSRPYDVTATLGLELARQLWRRELAADELRELFIAMAECRLSAARAEARDRMEAARGRLAHDTAVMTALVASAYPDNRAYARNLLRASFLPEDVSLALIGRLIASICSLGADDEARIADIAGTLLECSGDRLAHIGLEVIQDLVDHPAAAAQELAASLLLGHAELARAIPDRLLFALLDSPHPAVRGSGARLLGQLPDTALVERQELMVLLTVHEHADLRQAIRPVVSRLAAARRDFAGAIADALTSELMRKHARGVHSHILAVLRDDLRAYLQDLDRKRIWQLLHHRHPHAQELGGLLLAAYIGPDELSVAQIVKLASHEILSVRQGAWALCEKSIDRLRRAMPTAIRLLDARWQDSREFAFAFFRANFTSAELTPDILVAICDSVRPDVQQFGRELITRFFQEDDGQLYLLRLSEHPSEALQLFASSYLDHHAAGRPELIAELEPYFLTVLSRVNKGRVARQRCIAFLEREARASEAAAAVAARVLGRQSATIAVGDRAAMIKAMVDLERAHPAISTPLRIKEAPLRGNGAQPAAVAADEEARDGV